MATQLDTPVGPYFFHKLSTRLGLGLVLLAFVPSGAFPQHRRELSLRGKVVDGKLTPIAGASVIIHLEGKLGGPMPNIRTNEAGTFEVFGLAPGMYSLDAFKDEDGFGDLESSFYGLSRQSETVSITSKEIATVIINLGDPLGRLSAQIVDAKTNEPLEKARFRLAVADNPRAFLSSNPDAGARFVQPVPPVPITCEISMSGYVTWKSERIIVKQGEIKALTIALQKNGSP